MWRGYEKYINIRFAVVHKVFKNLYNLWDVANLKYLAAFLLVLLMSCIWLHEDGPQDRNTEHLLTKPINFVVVDGKKDVDIDRINKYRIPKAALDTGVP